MHHLRTARFGFIAAAMVLSVLSFSFGNDIAEEELKGDRIREVEFINYQGPYIVVKSLDDIIGIGRTMGQAEGVRRESGEDFTIIHAVGAEGEEGLNADILVLGPEGYVDHIINLRRIIAAYLEEAYGYSGEDAMTLATFITYYNAVFRQDTEYISSRYTPTVMNYLEPEKIGIALSYDQWPGNTMLLIPLTARAEEGGLGSIESDEISGDEVIEDLRDEEDKGLDERKDLVDLKEKEIAEEEKQIEEERKAIEEEEERLADERQSGGGDTDTGSDSGTATEDDDKAQQELDRRKEELEERETALEERKERVEEERDTIAEDQQEVIDRDKEGGKSGTADKAAAADQRKKTDTVQFMRVRNENGILYGSLSLIDFETGTFLVESPVDTIRSRNFIELSAGYLVLAGRKQSDNTASLMILDTESLEPVHQSEDRIYDNSYLHINGNRLFAVVSDQGSWKIGLFTGELVLNKVSGQSIDEDTVILEKNGLLYVQNTRGEVMAIDSETLESAGMSAAK